MGKGSSNGSIVFIIITLIRVPSRQDIDMVLESRKTRKKIVPYIIRNYLYTGTKTKNVTDS
jgi:hypothetical protein